MPDAGWLKQPTVSRMDQAAREIEEFDRLVALGVSPEKAFAEAELLGVQAAVVETGSRCKV